MLLLPWSSLAASTNTLNTEGKVVLSWRGGGVNQLLNSSFIT